MSSNDPLAAAKQAERDLNSTQAKQGTAGKSDSSISPFLLLPWTREIRKESKNKYGIELNIQAATESGVDTSVESKFPGAKVTYGSAASGAGDNREIPVEEGGDLLPNGR